MDEGVTQPLPQGPPRRRFKLSFPLASLFLGVEVRGTGAAPAWWNSRCHPACHAPVAGRRSRRDHRHAFRERKLTLGRAAELADMGQLEFQRPLPNREIPIHCDVEELEEDLRTLDRLREPSSSPSAILHPSWLWLRTAGRLVAAGSATHHRGSASSACAAFARPSTSAARGPRPRTTRRPGAASPS
jgi:hypothetical protein